MSRIPTQELLALWASDFSRTSPVVFATRRLLSEEHFTKDRTCSFVVDRDWKMSRRLGEPRPCTLATSWLLDYLKCTLWQVQSHKTTWNATNLNVIASARVECSLSSAAPPLRLPSYSLCAGLWMISDFWSCSQFPCDIFPSFHLREEIWIHASIIWSCFALVFCTAAKPTLDYLKQKTRRPLSEPRDWLQTERVCCGSRDYVNADNSGEMGKIVSLPSTACHMLLTEVCNICNRVSLHTVFNQKKHLTAASNNDTKMWPSFMLRQSWIKSLETMHKLRG